MERLPEKRGVPPFERDPNRTERASSGGTEQRGVPANCLKQLLDLAQADPMDPSVKSGLTRALDASVVTETTNADANRSVLLFCQARGCESTFTVTNKYSSSALILSGNPPGQECGLSRKPI